MKFEKEEGGRVYFSLTKKEVRNLSDVITLLKVNEIMKDPSIPSSYKAILSALEGIKSE